MSTVTKAVIPAAGAARGSSPSPRACPKEMLPVVDKPSIQYVVEEAVAAGLTDILIITAAASTRSRTTSTRTSSSSCSSSSATSTRSSPSCRALDDLAEHPLHPPDASSSASATRSGSRASTWATSRSRCCSATTSWSTTRELLSSMLEVHDRRAGVGARAARGHARGDRVARVRGGRHRRRLARARALGRREAEGRGGAVEPRGDRPLRVHARASSTPSTASQPGVGGELQLTDAIALLLGSTPVFGRIFTDGRYDIGKKLGFLQANIELALARRRRRARARRVPAQLVRPAARLRRRARDPARRGPGRDPRRGRAARAGRVRPAPTRSGLVLAGRRRRRSTGAAVRQHRDGRLRGARRRHRGVRPTGAGAPRAWSASSAGGHAPTAPVGAGRGDPHHDGRADARRRRRRS